MVLDNYATHKTNEVQARLEQHPRVKLHFRPNSASCLGLMGRFFAEITAKSIRRGSFYKDDELEGEIYRYLLHHSAKPKPFVRSKTAKNLIKRKRRTLDALEQIRENR